MNEMGWITQNTRDVDPFLAETIENSSHLFLTASKISVKKSSSSLNSAKGFELFCFQNGRCLISNQGILISGILGT